MLGDVLERSVRLDAVSLALLALVLLVALAVIPFAVRSLRGDRHGTGVTVALCVTFFASSAMILMTDVVAQAVAWSVTTASVLIALRLGGGRAAYRRPAAWLFLSDALLWSAVFIGEGPVAGVLLVLAAVIRAAGFPAHSWLMDAVSAPTPVSAALHGGVVNGGAILLLLVLPGLEAGQAPLVLAAALGSLAIVVGGTAMLVRTDIKGKLVLSTVAQLGFTLLCIGLGLGVAALLHLIAHGWYKSARFLASGDGVDRRARTRRAPAARQTRAPRARALLGAIAAAGAVVIGAALAYPEPGSLGAVLLIGMLGAAFATAAARLLGAAATLRELWTRLGAVVLVSFMAALALGALTTVLAPQLPAAPSVPLGSLVIAVATLATLALVSLVRRDPTSVVARQILALSLAVASPSIGLRSLALRRGHGSAPDAQGRDTRKPVPEAATTPSSALTGAPS